MYASYFVQGVLAFAAFTQAASIAPNLTTRQTSVDPASANATRAAEEAAKQAAALLASMPACGVSTLRVLNMRFPTDEPTLSGHAS